MKENDKMTIGDVASFSGLEDVLKKRAEVMGTEESDNGADGKILTAVNNMKDSAFAGIMTFIHQLSDAMRFDVSCRVVLDYDAKRHMMQVRTYQPKDANYMSGADERMFEAMYWRKECEESN